jgi:hypothetical protein
MKLLKPYAYPVLIVIVVFAVGIAAWSTNAPAQSVDRKAIVKLYSGDKVVGTWEAISLGSPDGESLVFTIGSSSFPKQVRISGTYSVEVVK